MIYIIARAKNHAELFLEHHGFRKGIAYVCMSTDRDMEKLHGIENQVVIFLPQWQQHFERPMEAVPFVKSRRCIPVQPWLS